MYYHTNVLQTTSPLIQIPPHCFSNEKKKIINKKRNEIWMKGAHYETKPHKDPNFNKKWKKKAKTEKHNAKGNEVFVKIS